MSKGVKMSFHAFIEQSKQKVVALSNALERSEWDLQCLQHRITTPELTTEKEKKVIAKKLDVETARVEKLKAEIAILTNMDELAKRYLSKLPANRKKIDLSYSHNGHSLSVVPDLSKFADLRELDLSHNEEIQGGFDRLPTTLRYLCMYKLKVNRDVNEIRRLVNLETLDMTRNDSVTELPDLSGLTKLKVLHLTGCWGLKYLPCLPTSLKTMRIPNSRYFNIYFSEGESLWLNSASRSGKVNSLIYYDNQLNWYNTSRSGTGDSLIYQVSWCINEMLDKRIFQINRVNRFDAIREELLERAAKLCLSPSRIEGILENGSEYTLDNHSRWLDIYEYQERRKYATEYGW